VFSISGNSAACNNVSPFSGSNVWVALGEGSNNSIAYSTTYGTSWVGLGTTIFTNCVSIGYYNNLWIASGSGAYSGAYSTNGINWYPNSNSPGQFNCISSNSQYWLGCSSSLYYSTDGMNWSIQNNSIGKEKLIIINVYVILFSIMIHQSTNSLW
jgi:hypothetical protein